MLGVDGEAGMEAFANDSGEQDCGLGVPGLTPGASREDGMEEVEEAR